MKVYFTCSTAEFRKYRDTYFAIRDFLIREKHILTRDWLPHTAERLSSGQTELPDIKEIYNACIKAIKAADVVIIEDTVSNFSTGHQITKALQLRKPTLVLWKGRKYKQFNQMFIHGIESDLLNVVEYTDQNLKDHIKIFLNKCEGLTEKNRFHLVLNNLERMYLDWGQYEYGKSRTRIIRDAVRSAIEKDKKFSDYLKRS